MNAQALGDADRFLRHVEAALKDHATLHVKCQKAMINHLHRTAEGLSPEQAKRYLDTMLPHVIEMEMEPAGH